MTTPPLPEPGWFPDPHSPGRERWWTGTGWSDATHRSPPRELDWVPAWTRAMWPGMNVPARVVGVLSWFTFLMFFGVPLLFLSPSVGVVVLIAAFVVNVTTSAFGIAALRRAPTQGGRGLAIWALVVPPIFIVGATISVVTALTFAAPYL